MSVFHPEVAQTTASLYPAEGVGVIISRVQHCAVGVELDDAEENILCVVACHDHQKAASVYSPAVVPELVLTSH